MKQINKTLVIIGLLLLFAAVGYAQRLPSIGSDTNNWGTILNQFLNVSHGPNGTILAGITLNLTNLNTSGSLYTNLTSCTALETDSNGLINCGVDDTGGTADIPVSEDFWNNLSVNISGGDLITPDNTSWIDANADYPDTNDFNNNLSTHSLNYTVATFIVAPTGVPAHFNTDGTADEVEIGHAINNATITGGIVYLREGSYTLSANIRIRQNVSLIGSGRGTVIRGTGSSFVLIQGQGGHDNIRISGINFQTHSGQTSAFLRFSNLGANENVRIDNNWFSDAPDSAITLASGSRNAVIHNNWMHTGNEWGIRIRGDSDEIIISDNTILNFGRQPIDIESTLANNIIISNNYISGESTGYSIESSGNNTVIDGNIIMNLDRHGIYLADADNGIISNNVIAFNDNDNTGTYDGIIIDGDSDNNLITGNRIHDNDRLQININDSQSDNNIIFNNVLLGNDYDGFINDSGTNTVISFNIFNTSLPIHNIASSFNFTNITADNITSTRFTGAIDCGMIDGGSDGDFCVDNTGAGGDSSTSEDFWNNLTVNISNGDLITPINTTWVGLNANLSLLNHFIPFWSYTNFSNSYRNITDAELERGNVTNNNQLANGAGYITVGNDTSHLTNGTDANFAEVRVTNISASVVNNTLGNIKFFQYNSSCDGWQSLTTGGISLSCT